MRHLWNCISALSLIIVLLTSGEGVSYGKISKKKRQETVTETSAPNKSPYEKFLSNKRLVRTDGFVTMFQDGKKIYLEIPDSLEGRKMILSTVVTSSSSPDLSVGKELSANPVYVVEFADSLLLLKEPAEAYVVEDDDSSIVSALWKSKAPVTQLALPVKCHNADSTARVVEATKLFDEARKDVFNMENVKYGDGAVSKCERDSKLAATTGAESFGSTVVLSKNLTATLTLRGMFGELAVKPTLTMDILVSLRLLPQKNVPKREADSRIGTIKTPYSYFSSTEGIRRRDWAARYDISDGIKIYIDPLFPDSWAKAVTQGIENWNEAFEAIGLGKVIETLPFTESPHLADPLVSKVMVGTSEEMSVTAGILMDKSSGEILSCTITVPKGYLTGVRRNTVTTISDVDERFQQYDLPDEAVCEVLRADIMKIFGRCLGLLPNAAGSGAYSPAQLRDPDFTSAHGITASVTDGMLFNYLAKPGDKQKGVTIIADRIGAYDRYAIEWLYDDLDTAALDSLIRSKEGQAEYVYVPESPRAGLKDARALAADLGNDVFAAYEAGMEHLKFLAEHSHEWLTDDVPEEYRNLFIDYIWLRFNTLSSMLSSQIGAVRFNDVRDGDSSEKMTVFPASVQKKALKQFIAGYKDISWLDANKELILSGGPNRDVSQFTTLYTYQSLGMMNLLKAVAMAHGLAGAEYGPQEFLEDVRSEIMAEMRKGKIEAGTDAMVESYILSLISASDVMKRNYAKVTDPAGKKSFALSVPAIPDVWTSEIEPLCYISLSNVKTDLQKGMSLCKSDTDKRKIKYLLLLADAGLGLAEN